MTMTAKRLAELDAAIARFPVSLPWYSCATSRNGVTGIHGEPHGEPPHQGVAYLADVFGDAAPVVEAMNSLPDLRAHIEAQDATIARLRRCLLPVQMLMAQAECVDEPLSDSAVVLSFMGSGASDQVTAGEVRAALTGAA